MAYIIISFLNKYPIFVIAHPAHLAHWGVGFLAMRYTNLHIDIDINIDINVQNRGLYAS